MKCKVATPEAEAALKEQQFCQDADRAKICIAEQKVQHSHSDPEAAHGNFRQASRADHLVYVL